MTDHEAIIGQLTPEEKVSLVIGADNWHTSAIPRLGVPAVFMTDGSNGVRKELPGAGLGVSQSEPATCFPPAVGLGCAFDEDLAEQVGRAMGEEARQQGVDMLLAPAINIKRHPLNGRSFEYFSEDPLVAGRLGAAMIRGIQSAGVGTSLKHFAVNNQETDRLRVSADVDERPLREIYLRGFEEAVRNGKPWTVMCSYNRVNGVLASQNHWLLTDVLRDEWGFDGVVVSDWGAVYDRVEALKAGLDLQMPGTDGHSNAQVLAALRDGSLDVAVLDQAVDHVLALVDRCATGDGSFVRAGGGLQPAQGAQTSSSPHDPGDHQTPAGGSGAASPSLLPPVTFGSVGGLQPAAGALAREIAGRCVVLLKNDGGVLPLSKTASIAVIGAFVQEPRFQGAGSAQVNAVPQIPLDAMRAMAGNIAYAPGFRIDDRGDDKALCDNAVAAAKSADVAVVFLGLPAMEESEGIDRDGIDLPANQLAVLQAVRDANPNVVVVLMGGGVVALPFRDDVPGIVQASLLGQGVGGAIADVLFGAVNPSGRLTETIPLRIEDTPAFGNFPGEAGHVRYGEGLLVGYRWYDARSLPVAYPFGHGLSYTTFSYGQASAVVAANGDVKVTVPVTNTGDVAGREIVQAYVGWTSSTVARPPRELKAFASVELAPGQTKTAELTIRGADLAYWDIRVNRWVVEGGRCTVLVGASSRDIRTTATVDVAGDHVDIPLTGESTMGEVFANPIVGPTLKSLVGALMGQDDNNVRMMASMPIGRIAHFPGVPISQANVDALLGWANGAPLARLKIKAVGLGARAYLLFRRGR